MSKTAGHSVVNNAFHLMGLRVVLGLFGPDAAIDAVAGEQPSV
jgi:hypothetical protein